MTYNATIVTFDACNAGKCIAGVFCDLTMAFHCVNHEPLVKKLEFYGVRGILLNWFKLYLDDRQQRIHPKLLQSNNISNWHRVEYGVHQGAILGPLLFVLYINDFPIIINKILDVIMFADDTGIVITANSRDELLQRFNHVLHHMSKWFQANQHT
jgi:hypothetical protein